MSAETSPGQSGSSDIDTDADRPAPTEASTPSRPGSDPAPVALDPIEIRAVAAATVTYPAGTSYGPRRTNAFELVWIVEGRVVYHADGVAHAVPAEHMTLSPPGITDAFTWDPNRTTRHAYIHMQIIRLPDHLPPVERWPRVWPMNQSDVVRPLYRYILAQLPPAGYVVRPGPAVLAAIETMLTALVNGPIQQAPEFGLAYPEPVNRAMAYVNTILQRDPSEKLTLDDLADHAHVSSEHLCRLFRSSFDVSPIEAVRLLRLDLAVQLLVRTSLSVKEIAHRCGFASPYHFSKRFSGVYGASPTTIRKRYAEGVSPPTNTLVRRFRAS